VVDASTGAVAQRIDYDEFGRVTLDTSPGFQPFGFAGGIDDRDVALVRFGARDYDAASGRWTTRDPIMFDGGVSLYEYSAADPVNALDNAGTDWSEPPRFSRRLVQLSPASLAGPVLAA
jgi:RHS repeat-associated protein